MRITKMSIISGKTTFMDLDITDAQLRRWKGGELIQNVFPHLSPDEREFLMTGITHDEWEENIAEEK
jgi:hypothetical protein